MLIRSRLLVITSCGVAASVLLFGIFSSPNDHGSQVSAADVLRDDVPSKIERIKWTTSRVKGTPEPPLPYEVKVAYENVQLDAPVAINRLSGTPYYIVAQQHGGVRVFSQNKAGDEVFNVLDVDRTVYGVAAHPDFTENGFIYVMTVNNDEPEESGSWVSRFTISTEAPFKADPSSELVLFKWLRGGHNGGCLRFGHDGYLYIATGDGSGIADALKSGQDVSDLMGSILRVDVDNTAGERAYAIPDDNPLVDNADARPEIYSFGHRQIWKFSFDRKTGQLWAGEVGQDLWEMVYKIKKGGNYGWSVREGAHPFRPERPQGPAPFEEPVVEHHHHDFRSITGGFVYHGSRLPELTGNYIYGDFDTGKVSTFRYRSGKAHRKATIADTDVRIVDFIEADDLEVYLLDYVSGQLYELVENAEAGKANTDFPQKLSETGLFKSVADHIPADGVIPYDVNSPLWSDNAQKYRFIAIPGDGQIDFDDVTYPQAPPEAPPGWRFPDGTVLVKTFAIETEVGNPESEVRLETRLLHHKRMDGEDNGYGAQVWRGYTYIWNDAQTDAVLAPLEGLDRELTIKDAGAAGGKRKQVWHFPSRSECTLCHTMAARYVLGVTTMQMNRDYDYGHFKMNQIEYLDRLGMFSASPEQTPEDLPKLADYHDDTEDVNLRARSYLQSNCSHCHRKWGGGNAEFTLLVNYTLEDGGLVGVKPQQGLFNLLDPELVIPGQPEKSMIYHRMTLDGLGRMPHIASNVKNSKAVDLIREWIGKMDENEYHKQTGIDTTEE
ncbi:MAG: PQQ-dependent sugar dehydrogenase [Pirellulales bacterium]|nr:PQQ-dependent sugar dehydrogenase [Pirellulales bacterium]